MISSKDKRSREQIKPFTNESKDLDRRFKPKVRRSIIKLGFI